MNIENYREYCLSLDNVSELFPFGDDIIVYKVYDKIFTLAEITIFENFKTKGDPDWNIEMRDRYSEITPGYHMNKRHWNDVSVRGNLTDDFLKEMILNSYRIVLNKIPKNKKKPANHYENR